MDQVKSKAFTLYTSTGGWLGQIVITSDGLFASATDWGNLSFKWPTEPGDFRKFLISLNEEYFGRKLYSGMTYLLSGRECKDACLRFAEHILPTLKIELERDLTANPEW